MEPIIITDLKIIGGEKGAVLRGLKKSEDSFKGFGEAYFSQVHKGVVKGWKRHKEMTLNLIVLCGEVEFFIYDNRIEGEAKLESIKLSLQNFKRLTIPPMVWFAFKGIGEDNLLTNIANIEHSPDEAESIALDEFMVKID